MSNKAELLKKIKALADRGVDGERESAQTLLARLMEQYGISETDLEEERRETAWFRYSQETERRRVFGKDGIRTIYGMTGAESIPIIKAAMEKLSDDVSEDYWEATEGNAKKALAGLLAFAQIRPDGLWKGD